VLSNQGHQTAREIIKINKNPPGYLKSQQHYLPPACSHLFCYPAAPNWSSGSITAAADEWLILCLFWCSCRNSPSLWRSDTASLLVRLWTHSIEIEEFLAILNLYQHMKAPGHMQIRCAFPVYSMMGRDQFAAMYSHPDRPRPGRRRSQLPILPVLPNGTNLVLLILILTFTLLTPTLARDMEVPYKEYNSPLFDQLARRGEIAVDRRAPPPRPGIKQRQDNGDPFGSAAAPLATPTSRTEESAAASSTDTDSAPIIQTTLVVTPTTTTIASGSVTSTGNATVSIATASSSPGPASPLPSPFDTSLGSNFTSQACPGFFDDFLRNATFKECHPTSLLLQNSNSFFQASRSSVLLSQALDASCGASLAKCSPLMASFATQLIQDSNCGQEYRNQNPLVTQAHAGLISYEPLYRATCVKSSETGNYCFADAITNTTNPSDSYPYYTALGTDLPAASRPTCNKCLQDTMDSFAGYAANRDQPVSRTYTSTAQQINLGCGPSFVNATVPVAIISSSAVKHRELGDTSALMAFAIGLLVACIAF
jgi:hypothetical protein